MSQVSISSSVVIQNALLASRMARRITHRLSVHGISLSEYLVMDYLDKCPQKAVPRIELADHLGMSASGVTRLIAPMEKNHIVERVVNPRDARQSLVNLSKTGQRLYSEASVSFCHSAQELLSTLSVSQQSKLVELYSKLV